MRCTDGSVYYGQLVDGNVFEGEGSLTLSCGWVMYTGGFKKGCFHGHGTLRDKNGDFRYTGQFYKGKMTGMGYLENFRKDFVYHGHVKNGLRHGSGICRWKEGRSGFYEGEWMHDMPEGLGKGHNDADEQYDGKWSAGRLHGCGTLQKIEHDVLGFRIGVTQSVKRVFEERSFFKHAI